LVDRFFAIFPAFENKNYSRYFLGQVISVTGSWLQVVAMGWLVVQLTHSALWLGIVTALDTLPSLLFSLHGGFIVDKFQKRKIIILTQVTMMTLAFILGSLTLLHLINIWEIMVLAFLSGTASAFDSPARNAFVMELVGKERLGSAVALNSGAYNSARIVGPAVAGFLIAVFGVGGAFLINAVSYIPVVMALRAMKVYSTSTKIESSTQAIKEGLFYAITHPMIRVLLAYAGILAIFGWTYATILPYISTTVYHLGAAGLGYFYSAAGLGALTAIVFVSARSKKIAPLNLIFGGTNIFVISIMLFSLNINYYLSLLFLYFVGFGLIVSFVTMNTTIQNMVSDHVRGRVMSIYLLMFNGSIPIGSFLVGLFSEKMGAAFSLQVGAMIVLVSGSILFLSRKKINAQYAIYQENKLTSD
jgi:MFS family permease